MAGFEDWKAVLANTDVDTANLIVQLDDLDNDLQEIFEAAAFGWKLKDRERRVEVSRRPRRNKHAEVNTSRKPMTWCSTCQTQRRSQRLSIFVRIMNAHMNASIGLACSGYMIVRYVDGVV